MKRFLVIAAFSAMLASPAFAQSYNPGFGTGNVIDQPALEHGGNFPTDSAGGSYAYVPPRTSARHAHARAEESISPNDPDTVYEDGQYVGRDPDPNVRLQMRRDYTHD